MNIINLTPHAIVLIDSEGKVMRRIESSGVARVSSKTSTIGALDGIPVTYTTFGAVEGLPAPNDGTKYIVSLLVMQQVAHIRSDLFRPDTVPQSVVRNADGTIIGVKALTQR